MFRGGREVESRTALVRKFRLVAECLYFVLRMNASALWVFEGWKRLKNREFAFWIACVFEVRKNSNI